MGLRAVVWLIGLSAVSFGPAACGDSTAPRKPAAVSPKGTADDNDWFYVSMPSTTCRDGSPAGYFYRKGTENNLLIDHEANEQGSSSTDREVARS